MRIVVFIIVTLLTARGYSQVLTLQQAIDTALKNSLDIQIARNNFEASQLGNHNSIAGGLPQVNGSLTNNQSLTNLTQQLSNGTTTKRNGNNNNALNMGITGSFVLFNGYRLHATKARLAALEKQSAQRINVQVQDVIANVMTKYFDIVRQDSYLKTIRQSIEVTLQRKKLVDARQSVGLANNADTYQAILDLNASEQELQSQELILTQAKADLMNLLTQRPDSNFIISDTIIVDTTVIMASIMDRINQNPQVLSATEQIRINELIVREIGAQRYPTVSLNGGYNYSRSQNGAGFTLLNQTSGPFIGFGLQVPIFNGGLFKRQQKIAGIDTRNASLTRQQIILDLETSAVRSWQGLQNNLKRLKTEQENNRIAADLLNLVTQRFQLGVGTIVDLREAQRSFVEAGFRLVNLAYAAKIAEIELKRLASQLTN